MKNGIYKLTEDFQVVQYSEIYVRDINFTPNDRRLPDIAVCRIFTNRQDAEKIIQALRDQQ